MKLLPVILTCGSLSVGAFAGGALVCMTPSQAMTLPGVEEVSGEISSVNLEANTFTLMIEGDASDIQFVVTDETVYTLDGEASNKEDALRVSYPASVMHEERIASSVSAITPE